eukprot:4011138-Alexandrium_andersonii.AAC.1
MPSKGSHGQAVLIRRWLYLLANPHRFPAQLGALGENLEVRLPRAALARPAVRRRKRRAAADSLLLSKRAQHRQRA